MKTPNYVLIDYVRWMGDRSFYEMPFCDTDALVLCDVSYFDIFPKQPGEDLNLRQLIQKAPVENSELVKRLGNGMKEHVDFIKAVASSKRFGELRIGDYSESLEYDRGIQFCAVDFVCTGLFNFIAYRGTDDTIAGWKEDFMIAFTKTKAQELALQFAARNVNPYTANYIAGHSKGANLALYASCMLPDELWNRVTHAYVLDGPGFCEEVIDLSCLDRVQDRTTKVIPEYSVIGKLFDAEIRDTRIVAAGATGIMQHEILYWGVRGNELDTVPEGDPAADTVNEIIAKWIEDVPPEDRQSFINELFGALAEGGAKTMTDVMNGGPDGFDRILFKLVHASTGALKAAAALPEQALFGTTFKNIRKSIRKNGFIRWLINNEVFKALILIVAGVICFFATNSFFDNSAVDFFIAATVFQVGMTLKRLIESKWKFEAIKDRLYLVAILVVIGITMFFKEKAMFVIGSILFAVIAIAGAIHSAVSLSKKGLPVYRRVLYITELVLCLAYAVSFLVIPHSVAYGFAFGMGICLCLDGVIKIVFEIIESRQRKKAAAAQKEAAK
jgi:hypothetical protein